jgi:HD-GYP domain-containing protein (c-di-GMP phosphodiesterase class II)
MIASKIAFLKPTAKIIRHHHERYDGKGYPDGLKGKEIPFESRIIAIADTFDALISDRPYRKRMGLPQAFETLEMAAGLQLDPDMVAAFLRLWKEGFF